MGIDEVFTAPHSPWQNPFAERLIGSIRRECLNHVLVLGERHLRRILTRYFAYYHQARTHLALDKDAPNLRPIELPAAGKSCSVQKSAVCTTATSARPRSPAASPQGITTTNAPFCGRSFTPLRTCHTVANDSPTSGRREPFFTQPSPRWSPSPESRRSANRVGRGSGEGQAFSKAQRGQVITRAPPSRLLPAPDRTACSSRGTSSWRWRGVPGPLAACPYAGRAYRDRGGSGRRGDACACAAPG
jgi:hypothetical protein